MAVSVCLEKYDLKSLVGVGLVGLEGAVEGEGRVLADVRPGQNGFSYQDRVIVWSEVQRSGRKLHDK